MGNAVINTATLEGDQKPAQWGDGGTFLTEWQSNREHMMSVEQGLDHSLPSWLHPPASPLHSGPVTLALFSAQMFCEKGQIIPTIKGLSCQAIAYSAEILEMLKGFEPFKANLSLPTFQMHCLDSRPLYCYSIVFEHKLLHPLQPLLRPSKCRQKNA